MSFWVTSMLVTDVGDRFCCLNNVLDITIIEFLLLIQILFQGVLDFFTEDEDVTTTTGSPDDTTTTKATTESTTTSTIPITPSSTTTTQIPTTQMTANGCCSSFYIQGRLFDIELQSSSPDQSASRWNNLNGDHVLHKAFDDKYWLISRHGIKG